jgi:ACS family allantoate permease-like MFS transporter
MLSCIICFSLVIPMAIALRLYYVRENARRDELQRELGEGDEAVRAGLVGDFADETDVKNLGFRYAL